jgi:hypothetical protein
VDVDDDAVEEAGGHRPGAADRGEEAREERRRLGLENAPEVARDAVGATFAKQATWP